MRTLARLCDGFLKKKIKKIPKTLDKSEKEVYNESVNLFPAGNKGRKTTFWVDIHKFTKNNGQSIRKGVTQSYRGFDSSQPVAKTVVCRTGGWVEVLAFFASGEEVRALENQ